MAKFKNKQTIKIIIFICIIIAAVVVYKINISITKDLFKGIKAKVVNIGLNKTAERPFKDGEKLIFRVKLGFLTVGRSQLIFEGKSKLDGKKVYLIKFNTKTKSFVDNETIYVDPDKFLPLRVERDIKMFGRKIDIVEEYNQKEKYVKITRTESGKTEEKIIRSDGEIDSILCLIYLYRMPGSIEIGKTMSINLPLKKINIKVKNIRNAWVPAGEFDTYVLESQPRGYNFWFDTSKNRLPLSVNGAITFGNARLLLEDVN